MALTKEEQELADKLDDAGIPKEDAEKWVGKIVEAADERGYERGYNDGWSDARG